jgi:hypothetical protein
MGWRLEPHFASQQQRSMPPWYESWLLEALIVAFWAAVIVAGWRYLH